MEIGHFSKAAKEAFLERVARGEANPSFVRVERGGLDDFLPEPFADVAAASIADVFLFRSSGTQTKRDGFAYGVTAVEVGSRVRDWLAAPVAEAQAAFHSSRDRNWSDAHKTSFDASLVREAVYRPFDRRFHYTHRAFNDFLRTDLRSAWGDRNVALYAMPSGTGSGPAVWVHGLIPDYHAFRGSYGGYAFPL
jgi:predicted helicase